MSYETLIIDAENKGIKIKEKKLKYGLKGLYKNSKIIIDSNISTENEKKCILMEELGHHYTTYGNIIDTTIINNNKQEIIARRWAYSNLISIPSIIDAYKNGLRNTYEIADFLGVTEDFFIEALKYYNDKYGLIYIHDDYIIKFDPLEIIKRSTIK